jgi:hypothetical protein
MKEIKHTASVAWNVYLGYKCIDTVYFRPDMEAEEIKRSLVDHDGYHPNIRVRRDR